MFALICCTVLLCAVGQVRSIPQLFEDLGRDKQAALTSAVVTGVRCSSLLQGTLRHSQLSNSLKTLLENHGNNDSFFRTGGDLNQQDGKGVETWAGGERPWKISRFSLLGRFVVRLQLLSLWQHGARGAAETRRRVSALLEGGKQRIRRQGEWVDLAVVAVACFLLLIVLAASASLAPKAQRASCADGSERQASRTLSRGSSHSRHSHVPIAKSERKAEAAFEAVFFREGQRVRVKNIGEVWQFGTVATVSDGHGSSLSVVVDGVQRESFQSSVEGKEYDCVEPVSEAISVFCVIAVNGLNVTLCPHVGSHTVANIRQGTKFQVYSHMIYKGIMKMLTKDGWASAFDDVTRTPLVTLVANEGALVGEKEVPNMPHNIFTHCNLKFSQHQCCPELVVSEFSECALFIPKLPFYKHSGHIMVEDAQGVPIFSVRCVLPPGGLHSHEEDLHITIASADNNTLFARAQRGVGGGIDVHSLRGHSCVRSTADGPTGRQVYGSRQAFFGTVAREAQGTHASDWSGAYAFTSSTGSVLRIHGNSKEGLINATDAAGHLIATAEFNRGGPRKGWRFLRVGPNVDAGLILVLVLSVNVLVFEAMAGHEARTAAQRTMYTELDHKRKQNGETTRRPR